MSERTGLLQILQEECFPNMKLYQIEKAFKHLTDDELIEILQEFDNG